MKTSSTLRNLSKAFPFIILSILIVLGLYVSLIRTDLIAGMDNVNETDKAISEIEWEYIETVMQEDYLAAQNQAAIVAEELKLKTLAAYPDIEVLRAEIEDENPSLSNSPTYLALMRESIHNKWMNGVANDNNDLFICDRYGVLMDVSRSTAPDKFPNRWEDVFNRMENPTLAKVAVEELFNQESTYIFWDCSLKGHEVLPNTVYGEYIPSLQLLHDKFKANGLDALKNIQFLAAAYITPEGDIFGVDDIDVHGVRTSNHKIVVVQTFNLYDQIIARHSASMEKFNTFREKAVGERRASITEQRFLVALLSILIIGLIYLMMLLNNVLFFKHAIEEQDETDHTT